jgi:Holliday junction resolvase-like predicted endonuclease
MKTPTTFVELKFSKELQSVLSRIARHENRSVEEQIQWFLAQNEKGDSVRADLMRG